MKSLRIASFLVLVCTILMTGRLWAGDEDYGESSGGTCQVMVRIWGDHVDECEWMSRQIGCSYINHTLQRPGCEDNRYSVGLNPPTGCEYVAGYTYSSPWDCVKASSPYDE